MIAVAAGDDLKQLVARDPELVLVDRHVASLAEDARRLLHDRPGDQDVRAFAHRFELLVSRWRSKSAGCASLRPAPANSETPRLRLPLRSRRPTPSALQRIQSDPHHMRFYPHPFSMQESREWIERMHERVRARRVRAVGGRGPRDGGVPGQRRADPAARRRRGRGGARLVDHPARARQGIATEAAVACRDWVFATLPVDHVISLIRPDNTPSRGVAENLGMTVWKQVLWGSLKPQTTWCTGWTVLRPDRQSSSSSRRRPATTTPIAR